MTITLKNIKTRARQSGSTSGSGSTSTSATTATGDGFDYSSSNLGDYFILILEILAGFLVFCWIATSNYLNAKDIDIDATYPIFGKKQVRVAGERVPRSKESMLQQKGLSQFEDLGATTPAEYMSKQYVDTVSNNPYATRFAPKPIDMSKESDINEKVGFWWWFERTQQSSYQLGGLFLHKVFDSLKGFTNKIDESDSSSSSTMAARIFTSILRILFDILSVCMFTIFLGLVFCMWIPGWLGGLTAFLPRTYFTSSAFLYFVKSVFILIVTFALMCVLGWVTIFPVIWQFFYLIYLMFVKQLRDNAGQFGTEFLKRMQSLVYIYVVTALIIAFASTELPIPTKVTVGGVSAIAIGIHVYMSQPKTE
jgi:hypothetical protein